MNTKIKFIRFVFALVLVLSALVFATSTALAQKPVKTEYPASVYAVLNDVCSFPVGVSGTINVTEFDFYDQSRFLTRIDFHNVEQDTFTANGKSLVTIPYAVNIRLLFDSGGNVTHAYIEGGPLKIWLPDGSLFISAGRVDAAAHGFPSFILSPDQGKPGNIAGFCAALAP
jgi:hypothetical protein